MNPGRKSLSKKRKGRLLAAATSTPQQLLAPGTAGIASLGAHIGETQPAVHLSSSTSCLMVPGIQQPTSLQASNSSCFSLGAVPEFRSFTPVCVDTNSVCLPSSTVASSPHADEVCFAPFPSTSGINLNEAFTSPNFLDYISPVDVSSTARQGITVAPTPLVFPPIDLQTSINSAPVPGVSPLDWSHFLTPTNESFSNSDSGRFSQPSPFDTILSEVEPEEETNEKPSLSLPLNEGSKTTLHDALVSIISYAQSAHLTGVQLCNLLDLLHVLLPAPNILPKSKKSVFQYFENIDSELATSYYCNVCWRMRSSLTDKCTCKNSKVNYYITCPLTSQLQKICGRPGFKEKISHRFTRTKSNPDNIEDVYDGNVYKEASQTILRDCNNLSLSWYSDGVAIYECSSYSLWVFCFVINELSPEERFKPENLILGGLWGDSEKPHPNVFLLPLYHEVMSLSKGFNVKYHGDLEESTIEAYLISGTADVPAKAAFMNLKGHAGYHSCPKCFIKGLKSKQETGNVMVFPHQDNLELRDDASYLECVRLSIACKDDYRGVIGPTLMSFMTHSDFIRSVSIDSMHCIYLGLTKQLLTLWFNSKYSEEPFSLEEHTALVNERLVGLNLPHFIERLPEDVTKLSFWKATLCRTFILYLALLVLKGIMKPVYFEHLTLFVNAISCLNKASISHDDLVKADLDLQKFCKDFELLYGVRHMSSNLHLLRHLSKSVEDHGNLWVSSCFRLEDLNGKLAALAHGTRHATMQICSNLSVVTELPTLISRMNCQIAKSFSLKMTSFSKSLKFYEKISARTHVISKLDTITTQKDILTTLLSALYSNPFTFRTFSHLYKERELYVASSYLKGSRNSSFCKYEFENICCHGKILTFVKVVSNACAEFYALICKSDDLSCDLQYHVVFRASHDCFHLVPVSQLCNVTFSLKVLETNYLIDRFNSFDLE